MYMEIYYLKDNEIHGKSFKDRNEANRAFLILKKKNLKIATLKEDEFRFFNSTEKEWFMAFLNEKTEYWDYELPSKLFDKLGDTLDEEYRVDWDLVRLDEIYCDTYGIPYDKYIQWTVYKGDTELSSFKYET